MPQNPSPHDSQPSLPSKWMDEKLIGLCHRNSARVRTSMSGSALSCQWMNEMDDILICSGWIELWMKFITKCWFCQPTGDKNPCLKWMKKWKLDRVNETCACNIELSQ